jgi:hypothetical protein
MTAMNGQIHKARKTAMLAGMNIVRLTDNGQRVVTPILGQVPFTMIHELTLFGW